MAQSKRTYNEDMEYMEAGKMEGQAGQSSEQQTEQEQQSKRQDRENRRSGGEPSPHRDNQQWKEDEE